LTNADQSGPGTPVRRGGGQARKKLRPGSMIGKLALVGRGQIEGGDRLVEGWTPKIGRREWRGKARIQVTFGGGKRLVPVYKKTGNGLEGKRQVWRETLDGLTGIMD